MPQVRGYRARPIARPAVRYGRTTVGSRSVDTVTRVKKVGNSVPKGSSAAVPGLDTPSAAPFREPGPAPAGGSGRPHGPGGRDGALHDHSCPSSGPSGKRRASKPWSATSSRPGDAASASGGRSSRRSCGGSWPPDRGASTPSVAGGREFRARREAGQVANRTMSGSDGWNPSVRPHARTLGRRHPGPVRVGASADRRP